MSCLDAQFCGKKWFSDNDRLTIIPHNEIYREKQNARRGGGTGHLSFFFVFFDG